MKHDAFPHASAATRRLNPHLFGAGGPRPKEPELPQGEALVNPPPGKGASKAGDTERYEITFRVFAVRPQDYDNYHCKCLQDALVEHGIIPDDNWRVLQGRVISEKCAHEHEERTEITIIKFP